MMSFPCISIEAWEVGLLTEVKTVGRGSNIPKINRLSKVSEHKQCPWLVPGVCHCWCVWCSLYSFFSIASAVWQTLCRSVEQVFGSMRCVVGKHLPSICQLVHDLGFRFHVLQFKLQLISGVDWEITLHIPSKTCVMGSVNCPMF